VFGACKPTNTERFVRSQALPVGTGFVTSEKRRVARAGIRLVRGQAPSSSSPCVPRNGSWSSSLR